MIDADARDTMLRMLGQGYMPLDVAAAVGISEGTIYRYLRGEQDHHLTAPQIAMRKRVWLRGSQWRVKSDT